MCNFFLIQTHLMSKNKYKTDMKQLILSLIIAATTFVATPTFATSPATASKSDTTVIVGANGDTAVITSDIMELDKHIKSIDVLKHLDDTVIDATEDVIVEQDYNDEPSQNWAAINETWSDAVKKIMWYISTTILSIVFVVLLFRYLNRRRKYRVIEKAIENNYPLPDGLLEKAPTRIVYNVAQPATPVAQGVPIQDAEGGNIPPQSAPSAANFNPLNEQINWHALKGFPLTVIGLCAMLFFFIAGAMPMVALCLIPFILGCSRLFTSYMDQRNAILLARTRYQQQQEQQ